jgi:dTDP-4-dehydrorhamnose 3,5-epimerase
MKVIPTEIADVIILEPKTFGDERGFFYESYNERELAKTAGIKEHFVQDNHSKSVKGVLRGLHYQENQPQGKLVRAVVGEIYDVAVDLRKLSKTYGQWVGVLLSSENKRMLFLPKGFAHGFLVLSETAEVLYKASDYYDPVSEKTLIWNDPSLAIDWPLDRLGPNLQPIISEKDKRGHLL